MNYTVRTRVLDDVRPLIDLCPVDDPIVWLQNGDGIVGWGTAARTEPLTGPSRFGDADRFLADVASMARIDDDVELPGSGLIGFGSFTFADDVAGSTMTVPRVMVGRRGGTTWLTTVDPDGAPAAPGLRLDRHGSPVRSRPRYAGSSKPDVHWLEAVADAIVRISRGELDKVVLARDVAVWSREVFDAVEIARRLTLRFPGCYTFVADGLVGATPELLVSRTGETVRSRALAGTAGRAVDEAEDAALGAGLLASAKDLQEHQLAADSVAEVLRPLCRVLHHDRSPRLLRLDNVQHLATSFEGTLAHPTSSLELVGALHPTAAVGGTPRDAAVALIRHLEGMDRGRYAGPVGWSNPQGDGEWGIALRCAQLEGARARLFAGVGVVAGSLPEAELQETRLKLLAMQNVLGGLPGRGSDG